MDVIMFSLGPLQTNCYLLIEDEQAVVVDPGGDPGPILDHLEQSGAGLTHILNTHLHFDHILGNKPLHEATSAKILASPLDGPLLKTEIGGGGLWGFPIVPSFEYEPLEPGETTLLGQTCMVLATPGHSQGSLSFYFPKAKAVFSGDLIFERSIGRTDFPGGDMNALLESVKREIFSLPPDTVIYSGHGPQTTVGDEKNHNPYFTSY